MEDWKEYRLGEMIQCNPQVKLEKGKSYNLIDIDSIEIGSRYVKGKELTVYDGQSGCHFQNGDTVMARITPCLENGKIAQVQCESQKGFGSTELFVFRGTENKTDSDYVFNLMSMQFIRNLAANSMTGASGRQRADLGFIKRIKWNFPPLPTQQKIASILSAYDNLIQNYKKQIEALQTAASELYKEWFVRFRFPGYKNSRFENGIPEGWKVEKLFDVAKIIYGYPFNSDEFCDDSSLNPVVRIRDILDNYTNTYTSETCDEKYWINPNEMLIGMDGIFHMSLWTGKRALQNQRTVRVTSKVKNLSNYYLYFSLYPQIKALEQMIVGTTVAHLGDKHLKKITILIPEDKILKMSFERLEPIMNRIYSLQQQITNLTQQRDLLLPRLMSDKLEIK